MRKRGPSLRRTIRAINPSIIERAIRPHYKKWNRDDGKPGHPPHDPVGMVLAMLVMLLRGSSRPDFTAFLEEHPEWLHDLRFETIPDDSSWSKLLARVPAGTRENLLSDLVHQLHRQSFVTFRVACVDSSFLPACDWDGDAAWGYVRRKDQKRSLPEGQYRETEDGKVLGRGYRVHVVVDADSEAPVSVHVTRANVNDVAAWPELHRSSLASVPWNRVRYLVADGQYDATSVRGSVPFPLLRVVIPPARAPERVKRQHRWSDKDERAYRKRGAVERFFSMMKSFFSLRQHGVTGLERVRAWVLLACLATLLAMAANRKAGRPVHSVKAFLRAVA